jgi:hypothetical protein
MVPVTFDRDEAVQQVCDDVGLLVEARIHTEPYFLWTRSRHRKLEKHVTRHGSLLDQLRDQLPASGTDDDVDAPIGAGGAEGRPPLAMDVLDVLLRIEAGTAAWVSVRLRRDLRETVEENLRLLVGTASRTEDWELRDLARDVHRWRSWAATLTGWQSPPFVPNAPCPLCGRKGTLRINPDQKRGLCVECGATWEEADGSIGLLADQIKAADLPDFRSWQSACDHSWRLTTVSPLGVSARCVACHGMETRREWPPGTPAWTELDEQMRGASA